MNSFFSLEGPLISFLDKCGRVVILTLLWVLCCIPIITISASSASFYYGIVKTIRRERSSPAKEFFRCFKRVFRKSILSSLGALAVFAILVVDVLYWKGKGTQTALLNMNLCILFLAVLIVILCYYFATLSRFNYSQKELIKFSSFLAFKHLPISLLYLIIILVMVFAVIVFPVFLVFLPGVVCVIISFFMENVFKKYIPKPEKGEEVWYDE